ncbi:helix-turn-helix transcriptional regulator [Mycobacterium sp. KBS0706]|uniref:helix-turn-helix domain-containing protein n=1 Tax=Mycobacterium sp. KBS0706 TaxID=2578109 RepID=UPI00110FBECB|nr:XRE family transcriptional regulator [Mycobacterium sp. KBS0706]TSD86227.1 helix-turn-helix transcriptional regulator [Mycobacterium sp. KBS0706]
MPPKDMVRTPEIDLAETVRRLRAEKGWTLEEAAGRTGLSRSALSKIERGEMSPTFQAMQKLARGFGIELAGLFGPADSSLRGRRIVVRAGEGATTEMPNYRLRPFGGELRNAPFLAAEVIIHARSPNDFADWERHDSDDFLYVLAGRVTLFSERDGSVELGPGDAAYFDARVGHAAIATGEGEARALWITALAQ